MKTKFPNQKKIIKTWTAAEQRIGKFVNLDQETIKMLLSCPLNLLNETVQSLLGRK